MEQCDVNIKFKIGDKVKYNGKTFGLAGVHAMKYQGALTISGISLSGGLSFKETSENLFNFWLPQYFELVEPVKTPHKHAELIKAWADGAEIQVKNDVEEWLDCSSHSPGWVVSREYRIKPEPKPDIVREVFIELGFEDKVLFAEHQYDGSNMRIVFDPLTRQPKSVELI